LLMVAHRFWVSRSEWCQEQVYSDASKLEKSDQQLASFSPRA
jgi:hypothetical protein